MLAIFDFDSPSVPLLERLLDEGRLPNLADLRKRGRWHDLQEPFAYFGARASVYTGRNLEEHGLYYPIQWAPRQQRARLWDSLPRPEAVWERVAKEGGRCLVVDPYEGWRPRTHSVDGVSGWQFRQTMPLRRWATSRAFHRDLAQRFGRSGRVEDFSGGPTVDELRRLRQQLLAASDRLADALISSMTRATYDLVWANFVAPHQAGHQFWDLGRSPVRGPRDGLGALEGTLADVYTSADTALGRVLDALPSGADVMVYSATGMGANRSLVDLLPEMLSAVLNGPRSAVGESGGDGLLWRLRSAVPGPWRAAAMRKLPDRAALELLAWLYFGRAEWAGVRAFALPGDLDGWIRLNLRGREAQGVVDAGDSAALADEIADGLATFVDVNGVPVVDEVVRVRDVLDEGPATEALPDLVVRWSDPPAGTEVTSARFGRLANSGPASARTGNHVPGGWALVAPGASAIREPDRPARLVDIAATACEVLNADRLGAAGQPLLAPSA